MKKYQEPNTILTIYAEDLPGLTGQLIYPFNRRDFRLHSLNVARTDLHDRIVITVEAFLPPIEIQPFLKRVRDTNGVLHIGLGTDPAELLKTGHYFMKGETMNDRVEMVSKTGTNQELLAFYNYLEGPNLLGFCKTTLIADGYLKFLEEATP